MWGRRRCCCSPSTDCNTCSSIDPLPLTDVNTTIGLFKISSTPPTWKGSYYLTMTSGTVVDIDGLGSCYWSASSSGPVTICYTVTCNGDGTVTVTRSWSVVSTRFTAVWIAVQDTSTPSPTLANPCPLNYGGFFCAVGRILTDKSVKTAALTDCSSFAWSDTLVADGANKTSDPVGGTVTLG